MILFLSIGLLLCGESTAQESEEIEPLPKVEVFGGYSLLRSNESNFHGWKSAVSFNIKRWLAVAVDADGHYFSENTLKGKLRESEHSITAGPHFAFRNKSRLVPFAYAMTGLAWESTSLAGKGDTHTGFAFETGGGIDLELNRRVAIRLIDVSASITHIDGHTTTKPKFSTGVVFHFGKK